MQTSIRLWRYALVPILVSAAALHAQIHEPNDQHPTRVASRERLASLVDRIHHGRKHAVDEVQALGAEALELLRVYPNDATEIRVRLDLSWIASRAGDMDVGLALASSARDLATKLDRARDVAQADYHLAVAHFYKGEPEQALAVAKEALEEQRELGALEAAATTLTLLGSTHRSRSDYSEAIKCHLAALELSQTAGNAAGMARSRNNIGLVYWRLEEYARARDFISLAVGAYRQLGDDASLASALSNTGLILVEMGNPKDALPILEEALSLQERFGSVRNQAKLLGNLAFAQEELGRTHQALQTLLQTASLREGLGDNWGLSRTLGSIAALHHTHGRNKLALDCYQQAAIAAERADAREELGIILKDLAKLQEELGLHPEALTTLRRHFEIVQALDPAGTARQVTEIEARALLKAQKLLVTQERFGRNTAIAGAVAFLLLAVLGWNLFRLKRRAHGKLEQLHARLADYAMELEDARGRIRGLEELLPICSYCKSIRDNEGDWQQLESYLHNHAGAQLTHGICPDCFQREVCV